MGLVDERIKPDRLVRFRVREKLVDFFSFSNLAILSENVADAEAGVSVEFIDL
jgi:hypothetical protein